MGLASSARPGGLNTRRASPPHVGHAAASLACTIGRTTSNGPQLSQMNA